MASDRKKKNWIKKKEFLGFDCVELSTGQIDLIIPVSVGPRILSLSYKGGENLFAELPDKYLEFPGDGNFYFYGGHRLWLAPEDPKITYIPDNKPIKIIESKEMVELVQEIDPITGIKKSIQIRFTDYDEVVIIDHMIQNMGSQPIIGAPWAITQFKFGGQAILPQQIGRNNKNSFLPNRAIILWPYTDINDPRIRWDNQFIFIKPEPIDQPLKIGISNREKWIAYFIDQKLFIKYADNNITEHTTDLGATSECYCNSQFVELETLGNMAHVKPLGVSQHREVWRIVDNPFTKLTSKAMMDFIENDEMTDVCRNMLER